MSRKFRRTCLIWFILQFLHAVAYPSPVTAYPAQRTYVAPPPPIGNPTKVDSGYPQHTAPIETTRGDGFWKGWYVFNYLSFPSVFLFLSSSFFFLFWWEFSLIKCLILLPFFVIYLFTFCLQCCNPGLLLDLWIVLFLRLYIQYFISLEQKNNCSNLKAKVIPVQDLRICNCYCRVTVCNPNPEELGYKPNKSNTINL